MDLHMPSATTEIMADDQAVFGGGRFGTDAAGCQTMRAVTRWWVERT
jgi:transposase